MESFHQWLENQSNSTDPSIDYELHCEGQKQVPVREETFKSCFSAWAIESGDDQVVLRGGEPQVLYMQFNVRVGYQSHYDDLKREYRIIEDWAQYQMDHVAPPGLNAGFFANLDFWWFDTHKAMIHTAYGSAIISLGVSTAVIMLSSRSLSLAFFSALTICYVVASVTATMVAFNWTLGFLESIAGSILIGISADFVTHFSHAYASLPGRTDRSERIKFTLIHMGPSVLAAAFTTVASAVIMLATKILFFQKFAYVLFFSVVQATFGAFVFFSILVDCIGPSHPTWLMDWICSQCSSKEETAQEDLDLEIDRTDSFNSQNAVAA